MTTQRKTYSITKDTLNQLVSGLDQDKVNALYTAKSGKPAPMQSKTKLITELGLTGAKKKAVEDFVYPPKAEKPVDEMTANQLTNAIKALNDKITKLQAEKKVFKDALDKKLK